MRSVLVASVLTAVSARDPWPTCLEQQTVFRHAGNAGYFTDLRKFGIFTGCINEDCSYSDKGHVDTAEDCPRLCAQVKHTF